MFRNVSYALISLLSLQGAPLVMQMLLAWQLPIDQFAVVRTVEAALQLVSAIAPAGISLLIVRAARPGQRPEVQRNEVATFLVLAASSALLISLIAASAYASLNQGLAADYFALMVWIAFFSTISRCSLTYLQGKSEFALVARISVAAAAAGIGLLFLLVPVLGIAGWVIARYLNECALAVLGLLMLRRLLVWPTGVLSAARGVYREGLSVSLSLIARSMIDNAPFLILSFLHPRQVDVATYGLAILLVSATMVLPSAFNAQLLTRFTAISDDQLAELQEQHRLRATQLLLLTIGAACALAVAGALISNYLPDGYAGLMQVLPWLATVVPLRASATLDGTLLFRLKRTHLGTQINCVGAAMLALLAYLGYEFAGVAGVIGASIGVEVGAALGFAVAVKTSFSQRVALRS